MHWRYSDDFAAFLRDGGFVPIVTVRHPLDVLISILHFSQGEPATADWIGGEGGDESTLSGADPTSQEFLEYALSARAAALLSVSAEWLQYAASVIHYEELVARPERVLRSVIEDLGYSPRGSLNDVVASHSLERLRLLSPHHFWRGQPGLWRTLIGSDFRDRIWRRHRPLFEALGYDCDGVPAPTRDAARGAWHALCERNLPMLGPSAESGVRRGLERPQDQRRICPIAT